MPKLLSQNAKMTKSSKASGKLVLNFGIPAGFSRGGTKTCPNMALCAKGCYAKQGTYQWSPVMNAYEWRFNQSLRTEFVQDVVTLLRKRLVRDPKIVVRIHDSGDFYSESYLDKWITICKALPDVEFYTYTKMVSMFKARSNLPSNLVVAFSYGGTEDALITANDRHSQVFSTTEALEGAGYVNAMENDLIVLDHRKIGLVYHGSKNKTWITEETTND